MVCNASAYMVVGSYVLLNLLIITLAVRLEGVKASTLLIGQALLGTIYIIFVPLAFSAWSVVCIV